MTVKFDAYVHLKYEKTNLCFRHAALRAVMKLQAIEMVLSDESWSACSDCKVEQDNKGEGK